MKKKIKPQHQPKFTYMKLPPTKWTFQTPRIQAWMYSKGLDYIMFNSMPLKEALVLNLFAGKTLLPDFNEYRVDVVKWFEDNGKLHDTNADWIGGAIDFIFWYEKEIMEGRAKRFKIAFLDPPYSVRKAREKYGDRWIGSFTRIKNELWRIMEKKNKVIIWGYSSVGMTAKRGYELTEIALVCHSGDHSDTIITVEDSYAL